MREFRRILVCQQRQLGDVLLATPALELLKARCPAAEVHLFTEAKCAPLLENNPHVTRVWALDKGWGAARQWGFYHDLRRQKFDLAVALQRLPRCRLAVLASGAAVRLAMGGGWRDRLIFTHLVEPPPEGATGYAAATKAAALAPLGIVWAGQRPRLYLSPAERHWADDWLRDHGLGPEVELLTVDPTHRRDTRRWPQEHYAELLRLALAERPRLAALLLYGPGEKDEVAAIAARAGGPQRVIVPQPMLTLRQMGAVMARAALHLGNCSLPRHMAVAVDTPSLTILGSTDAAWTCPVPEHRHLALGLPCQPCQQDECPGKGRACLTGFAPQAAWPALRQALDDAASAGPRP